MCFCGCCGPWPGERRVGERTPWRFRAIRCGSGGRAEEWGLAILRTSQWFRDPAGYVAPAGQWGDLGAATGTALAMLAIAAWQRGYARGPLAMLFAGSEAGRRGVVLLERGADT